MFDLWRGDLIISSLSNKRLFRARIREGRVILIEPIRVNRRVRDIVELKDGTLAMKFDNFEVGFLRLARVEVTH